MFLYLVDEISEVAGCYPKPGVGTLTRGSVRKGGGGAVMPLSIAVLNAFRLINALVAFFFFVGTKEKTGLLSTDRLLRLDEGK